MADDPNRARNIERVRRAKALQKRNRRKVGPLGPKGGRRALNPTRPNMGRRVGPPTDHPTGGRRVGPRAASRRELQPIGAIRRVDLAASRPAASTRLGPKAGSGTASRPRSVPRPPGIAKKVAQGRRLPPGHAKKAAGVQSARTFAPGALAKRMSSGTPRTGKPSRSQVRGLVPEPTSLIERIKAQGGKRGSGAPPRRSGKPSRSQFDRMVGR